MFIGAHFSFALFVDFWKTIVQHPCAVSMIAS